MPGKGFRSDSDQHTELARILGASGWYPGRRLDISGQLQVWKAEGYRQPSDVVCALVAEFDGLGFRYSRGNENSLYYVDCSFSAAVATGGIYLAAVRDYARRVAEELWPVGYTGSNHVTLMASFSGKIYGGYDNCLALYGQDAQSAVLNIFYRKDVVRIGGA